MKKIWLIITFAMLNMIHAQVDVYANPLMLAFGEVEVSGEYPVSDYFGVELDILSLYGTSGYVELGGNKAPEQSGLAFRLAGKYYTSPDQGTDGFYLGAYLKQQSATYTFRGDYDIYDNDTSNLFGGVQLGRKWVWDSGILFELGIGFGTKLSGSRTWLNDGEREQEIEDDFDGILRLSLGYRFGL